MSVLEVLNGVQYHKELGPTTCQLVLDEGHMNFQ